MRVVTMFKFMVTVGFVMVAVQVNALTISPTADCDTADIAAGTCWEYDKDGGYALNEKNPNATDVAAIVGASVMYELYRNDQSDEESGLWQYYDTSWVDVSDPGDAPDYEEATISYIGTSGTDPSVSCPECYLIVKDGQDPIWYLFDLGSWDGTSDIEMTGFWPGNGSISHVALFSTTPVPEPATMLLFGTGLIGLAGLRLRKKNK